MRGSEAVERLSYIDGVEIVALCDKYPDRVAAAQKTLERMQRSKAKEFSVKKAGKLYVKTMILISVYTPTPWHLHTPIAVYAMKHGKHAANRSSCCQNPGSMLGIGGNIRKNEKTLHDAGKLLL
jgi:predicted dehydrogenase